MMRTFVQDVRYALRMLHKNLGLSLLIMASLAVGIGANSAVFSVVDSLLLRPLPYPQPDRLANIWLHSPRIGIRRDWPSPGEYIDIQNQNHSFEQMALAQSRNFTLTDREQPELIGAMRTQSSLLQMLGAKPQLGRLLLPEEDKPGKAAVAILSDQVWRRLFNSDPLIVGKTIVLDGNPYAVAGVLQRGFALSTEVMTSEVLMDNVEVFLPLPLGSDAVNSRLDENYNIMVKLKPRVSSKEAQADVDVIANGIREKDKRDSSFGMDVVALQDQVVGDVRLVLLVVFGSVGLVLLIACANVGTLLLTRAVGREKEMAIRTALGAGWPRLARQLLTESVLLGVLGGGAGVLVAELGLFVLRALNPGNIPRFHDIAINGPVVAFALGTSMATGILFGLAPARRALRVDVSNLLKAGGRSGQNSCGLHLRQHSLGLLIVSEVGLSLILLIAAGLLIRTFLRLEQVKLGFSVDHVLTMQVVPTAAKYRDPKAVVSFYRDIESRIDELPGVISEGLAYPLPLTGAVSWGVLQVEGYTPPAGEQLQFDLRIASTDYFRTMRIPLLKGRFFTVQDTPDKPQVALVDERFARRFWPNGDPLGKHVWFDPKKPMMIIGVVGSVKQYGLDTDGKFVVYVPQQGAGRTFLAVRTSADPAALSSAVIGAIHAVDPSVLVYGVRTMQGRLDDALARQRFAGAMLGGFALFALLLAAVGLYGLLSHVVTQNTHDIGLLAALGAKPGNIFRLVVRQGMILTAIGVLVGLAGSTAVSRVMASLLFGISTTDAVTFGFGSVVLLVVALVATIIPAWRATRVDPIVALREE